LCHWGTATGLQKEKISRKNEKESVQAENKPAQRRGACSREGQSDAMRAARGAKQRGARSREGHREMAHAVMEASDTVRAAGEGHGDAARAGARTWRVGESQRQYVLSLL
jgi:hypothetical protein